MKRVIFLILISMILSIAVSAQAKTKVKADSEIIREFKSCIKNNEFLDFREKSDALRPIKTETLKTHKVYKDLIDIVKNEEINGLAREISIELLLYFKAESHEILGLESELIALLQSDNSGWYIKTIIIAELPNTVSSDDRINMEKLKTALKSILNKKPMAIESNSHLFDQKRAVFVILEKMGIPYADVKTVIEPIIKDVKSDLKTAAILFLTEYSISHKDFNDPEVKRFCLSIFKNTTNDYTVLETANAIKLYGNLLSNEENFHLQGSDEEIFLKYLKNENDSIIIAAAKSLYKVKAMSSVKEIVERLKEIAPIKDKEEVRDALIDSLIYMEYNIIYSKNELSPSKKKEALLLIRDTFVLFLKSLKEINIVLVNKLFDAMDFYGIEHDAKEYINLETIKKIVNLFTLTTEEKINTRIGKILGHYTGEGYGSDVDLWVRWVKEEERNINSKWSKEK